MESEVWRERLTTAQAHLVRAIRAVGRIELRHHEYGYTWVGTGVLVSRTVVATNRHVALKFARRRGTDWIFDRNPGGQQVEADIDFLEEEGISAESPFRVVDVLHVEEKPGPDLALLRVEPTGVGGRTLPEPLELSRSVAPTNRLVVTIGYPSRDSLIEEQEIMEGIFGTVYNKKRLAPGRIMGMRGGVLLHDCSTLSKNSGSAVVDLETGEAVGLHTGGVYLTENYAVPSPIVAEHLDRIDQEGIRAAKSAAETLPPISVGLGGGTAPAVNLSIRITVTISAEAPVDSATG